MKIAYRVHITDLKSRHRTLYLECGAPEFCCDRMENAWGALFRFGSTVRSRDRHVYLITTCLLASDEHILAGDPVAFCPYCGRRIEAVDAAEAEADSAAIPAEGDILPH